MHLARARHSAVHDAKNLLPHLAARSAQFAFHHLGGRATCDDRLVVTGATSGGVLQGFADRTGGGDRLLAGPRIVPIRAARLLPVSRLAPRH